MRHLCHASSAYIVVTVTQIRESATADSKLPMAHVQHEEHVVAMLNSAHLPTCFWGKALYTYSCLLNTTPSSAIPPDTTPYEMAHKHKLDYCRTQRLWRSW
jgi:hypothetical protein